jgi:large subunit ribosomal protein L18e
LKENDYRMKIGNSLKAHARKSKQHIWKRASEAVLASRKNRPAVNLSQISRSSKEGSKVLIPGKVLGLGSIDHKVTVAAYSFSRNAREKIAASGGSCLNLEEFMESNSNVKDVLLLA